MRNNTYRRRLLATSMISGALMAIAASPAIAQSSADESATEVDAVIVTGSRIRQPGFTSASPITSVGREEIALDQPVAVEELIRDLPAAVPAIGSQVNNGSGGGATVNLRGVGTNRTLVLVNGRRVVPFNLAGVVDTNVIPIALVERVDLVTGGASAVYGADAVAGVVNFVLRDNFEGAELTGSYGIAEAGDAVRRRADLTIGGNFAEGRGNAVASFGWTKTDRLNQDSRDFGLVARSSTTGNPLGSGTTVPGRFNTGTLTGGVALPAGNNSEINPATGALIGPSNPAYNAAGYNYNPFNLYQTPLDRYQLTALAHYEINPMAEVYTQLMYVRSDVATDSAPSGTFSNTYQVPIGNPFIPAAMRQQLCAARNIPAAQCVSGPGGNVLVPLFANRRFTELGTRFNVLENRTFQFTAGIRGDLNESWNYDVYFSHGESDQTLVRQNWGSLSKLRNALNTVSATSCLPVDATGVVASTAVAGGCVPINIFGAEGTITPEMLNYVNLSSIGTTYVEQDVFSASVGGDLGDTFRSPFANDRIGVAVGVEWRRGGAGNLSDGPSQIQGEVLGTGAPVPDRNGVFELTEGFVEALVPLISDVPFIQSANLELGYRHSEFYTNGSSVDYGSWKIGLDWAPVDGLRFRAMSQRATRSPNINELFAPQVTQLGNLTTDPCQGASINAAQANTAGTLSNLCRLTGVPLSEIGSVAAPNSGQINLLTGGNPNLAPEEADTLTIGVVWQPSFISNLTLSLDYYDIQIEGAVSSQSSTDVLDACYSAAQNPNRVFNANCALIGRNTFNGTLNGVEAPGVGLLLSNLGKERYSGYDVAANYRIFLDAGDRDWGTLDLSVTGTFIDRNDFQATPTSINRDCIGYFSNACGGPLQGTKFSSRATWNMGDFGASVAWRYMSGVEYEPIGPIASTIFAGYREIDAYNYFDLTGRWDITDNVRATLTINNLLDEQPPAVGSDVGPTAQNNGNTYPSHYDVFGRYYTLGLSLRF